MQVREIEDSDRAEVALLLAEGFPSRPQAYWQHALGLLSGRNSPPGFPRFGFVVDVDGTIQGVILLIVAEVDGVVRCNLSSWYVRAAFRKYATFLYQRTLKFKGPAFLNLSPSTEALPIAKAFGFKPYTGGTLLIDPRAALARTACKVSRISPDVSAALGAAEAGTYQAHARYGCHGIVLEDAQGTMLALYRTCKVKRAIPAARFVAGDTVRLANAAPALLRCMLGRGIPLILLDAPADWSPRPLVRHYPDRNVRYAKGSPAPAVGDLLETEVAIFGP